MEYIIPVAVFAVGLIFTFLSWLLNRSVSTNDARIEELEDQIEQLVQDRIERNERVNQRFAELDRDLTAKLTAIQIQLAKMLK